MIDLETLYLSIYLSLSLSPRNSLSLTVSLPYLSPSFSELNFNFMEGCFHLYDDRHSDWPGMLLSTGMEDYFDSAFCASVCVCTRLYASHPTRHSLTSQIHSHQCPKTSTEGTSMLQFRAQRTKCRREIVQSGVGTASTRWTVSERCSLRYRAGNR